MERHVFVSPDSLRKALKGWGLTLDEEGVFAFLNRFDLHDDGRIDFTGFSVFLAELLQPGEGVCVCACTLLHTPSPRLPCAAHAPTPTLLCTDV